MENKESSTGILISSPHSPSSFPHAISRCYTPPSTSWISWVTGVNDNDELTPTSIRVAKPDGSRRHLTNP
ncbi:hypothetical protein VTJ04DRAFT_1327 [Mycothermus thermophilus]|uniref:uncharacterized protein n=1 Tax=Humicola insolens TaxID=85995 RepID=UPI003744AB52